MKSAGYRYVTIQSDDTWNQLKQICGRWQTFIATDAARAAVDIVSALLRGDLPGSYHAAFDAVSRRMSTSLPLAASYLSRSNSRSGHRPCRPRSEPPPDLWDRAKS
jgi:hypothetical protein